MLTDVGASVSVSNEETRERGKAWSRGHGVWSLSGIRIENWMQEERERLNKGSYCESGHNLEPGTWNLEPWNLELWNLEPGAAESGSLSQASSH